MDISHKTVTQGKSGKNASLWVIAFLVAALIGAQIYEIWTASGVGAQNITIEDTNEKEDIALYYGNVKAPDHVQQDAVQAIFLTNGQVYFGHITAMDEISFSLANVFYLRSEGESSGPVDLTNGEDKSLVKLGSGEFHSPQDLLVISREQVLFWENLKPDSDVTQTIETFQAPLSAESLGN